MTELRNLRDSDSRALKEKGAEIIKLREEVQRLAGEVEVLRGVIEEGLKERRASREILHVEQSVADTAMSQDLEEEQEQEEGNEDEVDEDEDVDVEDSSGSYMVEQVAEPLDPSSIHEEELSWAKQVADKTMRTDFAESMTSGRRVVDKEEPTTADKTIRTDFATVGSTNPAESMMTSRRFVDKAELDRISAEVEERRSNRSSNSIGSQSQPRRVHSPSSVRRDRRATVEDEEEHEIILHQSHNRIHQSNTVQPEPSSFRPPTPAVAASYAPTTKQGTAAGPARFQQEHLVVQDEPETPFPQIRGEHLERLFFSAPEHNAKTCTVCYRRRHRTGMSNSPWSSSLYPRKVDDRNIRNVAAKEEDEDDEDEGFGEGSEEAAHDMDRVTKDNKGKQRDYVHFSKDPGRWRQAGRREGLPPQTVVVRVIRELEDDFTHYKRCVILFYLFIFIKKWFVDCSFHLLVYMWN